MFVFVIFTPPPEAALFSELPRSLTFARNDGVWLSFVVQVRMDCHGLALPILAMTGVFECVWLRFFEAAMPPIRVDCHARLWRARNDGGKFECVRHDLA